MLLVRLVQSFIVGLHGNIDVAQQYMNIWAIQRDAAMMAKMFPIWWPLHSLSM
jgi:hypothetical protein